MTQPNSIAKELSSSHEGRLIRATVADGGVFLPKTFPATELDGVMGLADDKSVLVLRSGVKILVALSYEQLEQRIYKPDAKNDHPVLDLRAVTGPAANIANTSQAPAIGDQMPDGTIFAGISPDTNKPMYATPADASLTMSFNQAADYAVALEAHGHKDWRVPTKAELNVLFNNRAAIGGFDMSGSDPTGWYWSASPGHQSNAWGQRFSDGFQLNGYKDLYSAVRCVR